MSWREVKRKWLLSASHDSKFIDSIEGYSHSVVEASLILLINIKKANSSRNSFFSLHNMRRYHCFQSEPTKQRVATQLQTLWFIFKSCFMPLSSVYSNLFISSQSSTARQVGEAVQSLAPDSREAETRAGQRRV